MSIIAALGADCVAAYEASCPFRRAARECRCAFRYARNLARTSGNNACVYFNSGTNSFSVYWESNGTSWDANPVTKPMTQGSIIPLTSTRPRNSPARTFPSPLRDPLYVFRPGQL